MKSIFPRYPENWHTAFVKWTPGFGYIENRYVPLPIPGCTCTNGAQRNPATQKHERGCIYFGMSREAHDAKAIAMTYPPKDRMGEQMEIALFGERGVA